MASFNLYDIEFEVVKKSAGGAGAAYTYRRGTRRAAVKAASAHPGDILTILNADISVGAGETIEILSIAPGAVSGSEGGSVLS